jgi:hypothetical protein
MMFGILMPFFDVILQTLLRIEVEKPKEPKQQSIVAWRERSKKSKPPGIDVKKFVTFCEKIVMPFIIIAFTVGYVVTIICLLKKKDTGTFGWNITKPLSTLLSTLTTIKGDP